MNSIWVRVWKLLKPYKMYLLGSLFLAIISVSLTLYIPILIGDGIDYVIGAGNVKLEPLATRILWIIIGAVGVGVTQWFMNLCNNKITYQVVKDVRIRVFDTLLRMPIRQIDKESHGDIISRTITDVEQFADGLLIGFSGLFTGAITILGTLIFMLSLNVYITLLVVIITPVSLLVANFIAKKTYHMFKAQSKERGEMTGLVEELTGNQKVVKAFGYEARGEKRFDDINRKLQKSSLRAIFFSSVTNPATRFVNGLVYNGVGILGAFLTMSGFITVGQLSCFLTYANQYTKPFNEISGIVTEFQNALASAARVFELMDEPVEVNHEGIEEFSAQGNIEIKDVSFSYDEKHPLIEAFNLTIQSGKRVAIVGPTGCGKTTFINLLMRFYDVTGGAILVDGVDIRDISRDALRQNFGMVLQETWLKNGTIAENIAYGKPEATREEIIEAAKVVHAHSFIKRMVNGYDTMVAEGGSNLSQGQKQLLCIARVMLLLPPMLILDEATSSIDTRTELRVGRAFQKMMEGRTSFIVAHRLSTIQEADIILVMRDGHIVEQGSHQELLAANGFYKELYMSQFA